MELLRITRQIHCKAVEQRATMIHRQYNRDWVTSYSRPPIDPYLTSPRYKILEAPLFQRDGSREFANSISYGVNVPFGLHVFGTGVQFIVM